MRVLFGRGDAALGDLPRFDLPTVMKHAPAIDALVIDAREPIDRFEAEGLLAALFDDPRRPRRRLRPERIVAWIAAGDVETAFALGRFGIAGAFTSARAIEGALERMRGCEPDPLPMPTVDAPARSAFLGPRRGAELPTVAIGHRHAPETLDALARYIDVLRAHAAETSIYEDVATLIEVMLDRGLTCQTNLAAKAGVSHSGQFIGSMAFYRSLRRTRYGRIVDPPCGSIAMDVFIAVDEVLHEVLHLLFLANELRTGRAARHTLIAEELSLTWFQGAIHRRVFPDWLSDGRILAINDDFLLSEANAARRGFFETGTVFSRYETYPWIPHVIDHLPERRSYIGERPDLTAVLEAWQSIPEAAFLCAKPDGLRVPVAFDAYPPAPSSFSYAPDTNEHGSAGAHAPDRRLREGSASARPHLPTRQSPRSDERVLHTTR